MRASYRMIDEIIAEWAYFIYLDRTANGIPGDADSDWFQARQNYDDACEKSRIELIAILEEEIRQEWWNMFMRCPKCGGEIVEDNLMWWCKKCGHGGGANQ
jgi:hypothetical protein